MQGRLQGRSCRLLPLAPLLGFCLSVAALVAAAAAVAAAGDSIGG